MRKIPTMFVRDWDGDRRYVLPEVTPGCEWVTKGEGTPTRKYDGTCVMFDGDQWWARREVRKGKTAPPGFIELEVDPETAKAVGWEPAGQSGFARWHAEALAGPVLDTYPASGAPVANATYELVGPKINGNPENVGQHVLVRHGYMSTADLDKFAGLPRDFDGLARWLHAHPYEGVVFHKADGAMTKIKRRDFRAPAAALQLSEPEDACEGSP